MKIGDIFYRDIKKGFYPSYTNFVNAIRDELKSDFLKQNRQEIKDYYSSQEIVQIFQPPPLKEALKRKEGFYPKIISFYPFERLYMDTGVIRIFDEPRSKKKGKKVKPAEKPAEKVEEKPAEKVEEKTIPKPRTKTKELTIKLYDNKTGSKDTAFIVIKDSKGINFRFEKRIAGDIPASIKYINDNILQPYLNLTNDDERDQFLVDKKASVKKKKGNK